jgi:hypothetical protein
MLTNEEQVKTINHLIKNKLTDKNDISDGYHTFGELYEHRNRLYISLCKTLIDNDTLSDEIWISQLHSDGSSFDGWFIMGINRSKGSQMSYHLPMKYWEECIQFAEIRDKAPEFDGHTSNDVIKRLTEYF